jgi:hypothetical protein
LKFLHALLKRTAASPAEKARREWDIQRARAKSPSELSEIDAIFSRAM